MWEKMMFNDESNFCLFCNHGHVRRFPGDEFKPECLNLTMKHILKVWAAWLVVNHRWICLCNQEYLHTAALGAISTAASLASVLFLVIHVPNRSPTGSANFRTLTLSDQSLDLNQIGNLVYVVRQT